MEKKESVVRSRRQPIRDSHFYEIIWQGERRFMRVLKCTDKNEEDLKILLEVGDSSLIVWHRIDITEFFLFISKLNK